MECFTAADDHPGDAPFDAGKALSAPIEKVLRSISCCG